LCVTGTKGKSTTASLLAHVLNRLGQPTLLMGNIGTALRRGSGDDAAFIVIEVSSYQAANFDGLCDMALLTALYPEHLDWHRGLHRYYDDKLNLLRHAKARIVTAQAAEVMRAEGLTLEDTTIVHQRGAMHIEANKIFDGAHEVGYLRNAHLGRAHNLANICLVLAAVKQLGFNVADALAAMEDFTGLPHRQQELGHKDGLLFVDDSISTTPQSAIAAMEAYAGMPITLIAGGFDRGIDYTPLADYIKAKHIGAVIVMGPSGERIADLVTANGHDQILKAATMPDAVAFARQHTPAGGVVLLSPAAPSYGLFKNFEERGQAFAAAAGFVV
jgi:UDP-N-acetylmuramoylalanine--D-glutamate ligase